MVLTCPFSVKHIMPVGTLNIHSRKLLITFERYSADGEYLFMLCALLSAMTFLNTIVCSKYIIWSYIVYNCLLPSRVTSGEPKIKLEQPVIFEKNP